MNAPMSDCRFVAWAKRRSMQVPAADVVVGSVPSEYAIRDVAAIGQTMIAPNGSVHATADYQRHIAGVLTERALQTAYQRGRDGH